MIIFCFVVFSPFLGDHLKFSITIQSYMYCIKVFWVIIVGRLLFFSFIGILFCLDKIFKR